MKFATVRLGKTSVNDIMEIMAMPSGIVKEHIAIDVVCTQVPEELLENTVVFLWLGSDNSKGAPTEWIQGFKAVGIVEKVNRGAKYNDESTTRVALKYVFANAISRLDVLRDCPEGYYWCSSLPIIGLDDHSNQTIRCFADDSERGKIGAFLYSLNSVCPTFRHDIVSVIPQIDELFWEKVISPKTGEKTAAYVGGFFPPQLITYGAPGTGKSHQTEEVTKQYADTIRTTFHPDSDYSTFVGCYKPTMRSVQRVNCIDDKAKMVTGADGKPSMEDVIAYSYVPQAFVKAYLRAWKKMSETDAGGKVEPQFLVIEEINRGNCAQIFGDLFQLLDRNGNDYSTFAVEADSDLGKFIADEMGKWESDARERIPPEVREGKKLLLPPNFHIWATMNTSDQSLFPIDSAFKRRWDWQYIPIRDAKKGWKIRVEVPGGEKAEYDWWTFLETVNGLILSATQSEDKQLGYFFAKPDKDGDAITAAKFVNKVLFYLYNDVFKDYDLPKGFAKADGKGKFAFKDFFLSDGKPDGTAVKALLDALLGKSE